MRMNYVVEILKCKNGVRLPLVLSAKTQMPHGWSMDYSLANHLGRPINTSLASARSVAMFHTWAEEGSIDLDQRFSSGNLFTTNEMSLLGEFLWIGWSSGATEKRGSKATGKLVTAQTHESRVNAIISYIEWRSSLISSAKDVTDTLVSTIASRLKDNLKELKKSVRNGRSKERGYLTEEQCGRLLEIVRPGSPDNPFQNRCQNRNYFIFLFYYELGARRSELLVLKSSHLNFGPKANITITFTPDDPRDPRLLLPSVKTLSRTMPISQPLAQAAEAMLKDRQRNKAISAAARKTPFIVLSMDNGTPLTISSVDRMFKTIRERFPKEFPKDFAPHHLRRSWNYRFSKACQAEGMPKDKMDMTRRYLMGWTKTSQQVEKYNGQFIEEMANEFILQTQDKIFEL